MPEVLQTVLQALYKCIQMVFDRLTRISIVAPVINGFLSFQKVGQTVASS